MAVTGKRIIQISFSGDFVTELNLPAASNAASPGKTDVITLAGGANTISPPSVTGITVTSLTIIPPVGNLQLITLKGVAGDTGVPLHKTDPTSIALDSTFVSLVLNAAAQINGVRLVWS